jgi:hypothetical protein
VLSTVEAKNNAMAVHARKQDTPSGLLWMGNVSKDRFVTSSTPWQRSVVARRARQYFDKAREQKAVASLVEVEEQDVKRATDLSTCSEEVRLLVVSVVHIK